MSDVVYEIVQHDGGWAYKVNGMFSEPFLTHAEALAAAQVVAAEQEKRVSTQSGLGNRRQPSAASAT